MASAAAQSSPKPPALSYAERARKAQGVPTPNFASTTSRIGTTSSTPAASTVAGATSPGPRPTPSHATGVSSKAVKPETSSSLPSSSAMALSAVTGQPNRESRLSNDPERKQVSGATAQQQIPPKAPPANVWNVRKEQLSASRPVDLPTSTSTTIGTAKPQRTPGKGVAVTPETVPGSIPTTSLTPNNQLDAASRPSAIDSSFSESHTGPHPSEMAPSTTISIDAEVWPEVGKQVHSEHQESTAIQAKEVKEEGLTGIKRGEKTKWIPIPAAELQAAADAMLKTSKSQSRRTSRGPSRSNHDSRGNNTRNPSGRNSTSQSNSQSRVHSRSGSVHSSPRFSRGRRLPGDESQPSRLNGNHSTSNTLTEPSRYSRQGSPYRRPDPSTPMPEPQPAKPGDTGNGASSSPQVSHQLPMAPHPYLMYPPLPGFNPMPGPVHYPLASSDGSPSVQPPISFPHGALPYPPYPIYGGYEYGAPPVPPMFWNGVVSSRSGQHSPAYPPSFPSPSSLFQSPSPPPANRNTSSSSPIVLPTRAADADEGPSQPREAGSSLGEKPVLFGSIGIAVSNASSERQTDAEGLESAFSKFSIGVSQKDMATGLRSRTKSTKDRERSSDEGVSTEPIDRSKAAGKTDGVAGKWEFGTTNTLSAQVSNEQTPAARLSPMSGSVSPAQLPIVSEFTPPVPTQSLDASIDLDAEFKVKDFGYGFGRPGAPPVPSEQPNTESRHESDRFTRGDGSQYGGKVRRSGPREDGFERGTGRGGRRGRGAFIGGRGQSSRSHQRNGSFQGLPPRQHPFSHGTPSPSQHQMPHEYFPGRPPMMPYVPPHGYDTYGLSSGMPTASPPSSSHLSPPVPVPVTTLAFPLDPTRYYLLGQLEYYLSAQNMAQDFYLRQRMDSRGWIAIPLIASFNRVRQLTMDANVVREVLCISSIVQVHNNWVRMGGWEQWVLPDAPPSSVDEGEVGIPYAGGVPPTHYGELLPSGSQLPSRPTIVVDEHGHMHKIYTPDGQGEEDDDDEVEFVLGKDS